jgi:hypothetical protein
LPFESASTNESINYRPIPPYSASSDELSPLPVDSFKLPFEPASTNESTNYRPIPPYSASPDELPPLPIDSFNLPFEPVGASESTNYRPIPPYFVSPMASTDIPVSFMPVPPLAPSPVTLLKSQPPEIKNDPLLGEAMRQAQAGLFVVLGREKSLTESTG